jgi:hypothetical protein
MRIDRRERNKYFAYKKIEYQIIYILQNQQNERINKFKCDYKTKN